MRQFVFSIVLALLPVVGIVARALPGGEACGGATVEADSATADSVAVHHVSRFDHREHRARRYWANLIPTQVVLQNAGNMGIVSVGIGWEYGRRTQWETHLLWGFIPKYNSTKAHATSTLKQNYIPWSISFNDWLALEPLEATVYVNTVYGHEFWRSQPGRYPDKYYEALSTKFRINVGVGQRVTLDLNPDKYYFKGVTFFYEVSSCDLYIRSLFQGTAISFWDILGLSLGFKLQLL